MVRALGDYGRLMVFPWNLHMERTVQLNRSRNEKLARAPRQPVSFRLGILTAAALAYGKLRKGKRGRSGSWAGNGSSWLICRFPTCLQLNATVAEHWLYLPSVGFLIFLAGCCLEWPARVDNMAGRARRRRPGRVERAKFRQKRGLAHPGKILPPVSQRGGGKNQNVFESGPDLRRPGRIL